MLIDEQDEGMLTTWLIAETCLDAEHADTVSCASLPDGCASLGRTANGLILQELVAELIHYSEAVKWAGEKSNGLFQHHSNFRDGEILTRLPCYGQVIERHVGFSTGEPDEKDLAKKHGCQVDQHASLCPHRQH